MISRAIAELWSPALGAAGGLFLALPFFADYFSRRRRKKRLKNARGPEVAAKDADKIAPAVAHKELERVLAAEPGTVLLAGIGCLLLVASFVILWIADPA